jgi:hypothetical protein
VTAGDSYPPRLPAVLFAAGEREWGPGDLPGAVLAIPPGWAKVNPDDAGRQATLRDRLAQCRQLTLEAIDPSRPAIRGQAAGRQPALDFVDDGALISVAHTSRRRAVCNLVRRGARRVGGAPLRGGARGSPRSEKFFGSTPPSRASEPESLITVATLIKTCSVDACLALSGVVAYPSLRVLKCYQISYLSV